MNPNDILALKNLITPEDEVKTLITSRMKNHNIKVDLY